MRLWPKGDLAKLRAWCDRHGVHLILDEIMTGFGRTGTMFACEQENVLPDFLCLAKGLTGGYLPLAATLTTERIYAAFLGEYRELKTFFLRPQLHGQRPRLRRRPREPRRFPRGKHPCHASDERQRSINADLLQTRTRPAPSCRRDPPTRPHRGH